MVPYYNVITAGNFLKTKSRLITLIVFILATYSSNAQVIKKFTPRTSDNSPLKTIYNIKGDFTMIGNTNLTLVNYSETTENGNNDMQYVDIDNDPTTINSSSAELTFSTENNAIPECSNIIYAGLYWTGRASNSSENVYAIDHNNAIGHNGVIGATSYTLTISRQGSGNNVYPRYVITSTTGVTILFEFNNNNTNPVRYSTNNGSTWLTPANQSIQNKVPDNDSDIVTFDPITLGTGTNQFTIAGLQRDDDDNEDLEDTQNNAFIHLENAIQVLNKRTVSLKGPSATNYTEFTASTDNILYPANNYGKMYAGYVEITDYVINHGLGNYFVANIALTQGNGGDIGFFGGWGMVVVYENSKMKWRDITVFDGYAYVQGSTTISHTLDVSGFKAVQNGNVNLKLGLMTGEGDNGISGDYFEILRQDNNTFQSLSHSGNQTDNFFNSSVEIAGNKNPDLVNNTGLDIAMFDVVNTNNGIIDNSQESTQFRYGSTQDTYTIFNITFAVDAYIPDTEGLLTNVSSNTTGVSPGETAEYTLQIKNKGNESIENFQLSIPIPFTSIFDETAGITYNTYYPLTTTNTIPQYIPPTTTTQGYIVWDIGTLPVSNNPDDILADISFSLIATTDCAILMNPNCQPTIPLTGNISGTGSNSGTSFTIPLIKGYETDGICIGDPIPTPLTIGINAENYVNENCTNYTPVRDFYFCNPSNNTIATSNVSSEFPAGTKYYNQYPVTNAAIEYGASNPFPATVGTITYFAVPPGLTGCYYQFRIIVSNITSQPSVTNIKYCLGETASPLTGTPSDTNYTLFYYTDNNPTTEAQTSITPSTTTIGETTYYVAEGVSSCISPNRVPLTVTITGEAPEISAPTPLTIIGCNQDAITTTTARYPYSATTSENIKDTFTEAENYTASDDGTIASITYIDVIDTNSNCPTIVTRTFTITDNCEQTATAIQTINITDSTPPTLNGTLPEAGNPIVGCISTAPQGPTADEIKALYSDECGEVIVEKASETAQGDDCNWSITHNYIIKDACGNRIDPNTNYDFSLTYSGGDTTPPVINTSTVENITIQCGTDSLNTLQDWLDNNAGATATDNCGTIIWSNNYAENNTVQCDGSTITVTFTATDACGLSSSFTASYAIIDNTNPTFTVPNDITVECDVDINDLSILGDVTNETDNCTTELEATYSDIITTETCTNGYTITRTWTLVDACNNSVSYNQIITVQDTTAPILITEYQETDTANCIEIPKAPQLEFTDNCSTDISVEFEETNTFNSEAPTDYEILRTWTASDACGNKSVFTQTVTVIVNQVNTQPIEAEAICFDEGDTNLNSFLRNINPNGIWEIIEGNTIATLTGAIFNTSNLVLGQHIQLGEVLNYKFRYTAPENGCINVTELTMSLTTDCSVLPCNSSDISVSKTVTPNNDSYNEFFEIKGIENCDFTIAIKIFNRWGALIFESDNYQNDWNGTASRLAVGNSRTVPTGTYYYIVELKDSGLKPFTGPVYLVTD